MDIQNEYTYPFGEQLFIGIIKFYDSTKKFGFVVSNNYRMDSNELFCSSSLEFHIDESSWKKKKIDENSAVVFVPSIVNQKLHACQVRSIDLRTDKKMILDYYEHNNSIRFTKKVKSYSINSRTGYRRFEGYENRTFTFNILIECGITTYQLLNEYSKSFEKNQNYNELISNIDRIIVVSDGDSQYRYKLIRNHDNRNKNEREAWKKIISLLSLDQLRELIQKHPSIQLVTAYDLLLNCLDIVDENYMCSELRPAYLTYQRKEKIKQIEKEIDSHLVDKSQEEIESILQQYMYDLSDERLLIIYECLDKFALLEIEKYINDFGNANDSSSFYETVRVINNTYNRLHETGHRQFSELYSKIYEQTILSKVDSVALLPWNDSFKIIIVNFVLEDKIISSEKIMSPLLRFKNYACNDYKRIFVEMKDGDNPFDYIVEFDCIYGKFFDENEHKLIMREIEKNCLSQGNIFHITKLFQHLGKKLPEETKCLFVSLSLESIVSNVNTLSMFEDNGCSLLHSIVDKILSLNADYFYCEDTYETSAYTKRSFVKDLIAICGSENVEREFVRLRKNDRICLFIQLRLKIITTDELKEVLINAYKPEYDSLLTTEFGSETVIRLILDSDCSSKDGIKDTILWLQRYLGDEPTEYYEKSEWYKKKNSLILRISNSNNEYLKILIWALYFQSSANLSILKDVYYKYDTSLQIRILKEIFSGMALGVFEASLDSLKRFLGTDIHQFSLPIQIVLTFLELKLSNSKEYLTEQMVLSLFYSYKNYDDWFMVNEMLDKCNGRTIKAHPDAGNDDTYHNFNGVIMTENIQNQKCYTLVLTRHQLSYGGSETRYNNAKFDTIKEYISFNFNPNNYTFTQKGNDIIYRFNAIEYRNLQIMADAYRIKIDDINYSQHYSIENESDRFCCECRLSNNKDSETNKLFLWCKNKPCFAHIPHFHTSSEWADYTVLDFMRILSIDTDYINRYGVFLKNGQYIILSSFFIAFHNLFKHLKCRECGKLMSPTDFTNFARSAVTNYKCDNPECSFHKSGQEVYLNRCFSCDTIIDSRDSKKCPNESYICSNCGACCSNAKYLERYNRLQKTGGIIYPKLREHLLLKDGHWENGLIYCYKCGEKMENQVCPNCGTKYANQHPWSLLKPKIE